MDHYPDPGQGARGYTVTVPTTMMALRARPRRGGAAGIRAGRGPGTGSWRGSGGVHAAGIMFAELTWDLTRTTRDGRDRTPVIPSHEVSRVVRGLCENARGRSIGEEVHGLIAFDPDGASADYVTFPAADLADRPRSVSHVQAASLPLAALTAWQALTDHAGLQPGERVLVQGGAGGVGGIRGPARRDLRRRWTATGCARKGDFVRSLGSWTFTEDAGGRSGMGSMLSLTRWAGRCLRRPTASRGAAAG